MDLSLAHRRLTSHIVSLLRLKPANASHGSLKDGDEEVTLRWMLTDSVLKHTDQGSRGKTTDAGTGGSCTDPWFSKLIARQAVDLNWGIEDAGNDISLVIWEVTVEVYFKGEYLHCATKDLAPAGPLLVLSDVVNAIITVHTVQLGPHITGSVTAKYGGTKDKLIIGITGDKFGLCSDSLSEDPKLSECFGDSTLELNIDLRVSTTTKISNVRRFFSEVDQQTNARLSQREENVLDKVRRVMTLNRTIKGKLVLKPVDGSKYFVDKEILTDISPVFQRSLRHDMVEKTTNTYKTVFSADVVEQFLLYCHCGLVRNIDEICLELAKMAHQYEVHCLTELCEFYLVKKFSGMVKDANPSDEDCIFEIAEAAGLLDLKMLLGCIYLYLTERFPRLKLYCSGAGKKWLQFFARVPAFPTSMDEAVERLLEQPVDSNDEEKKSSDESGDDEEQPDEQMSE